MMEVLAACRGAFTAPTFVTFALLVGGSLSAVGPRTVTGMWASAGMAGRRHWSRAHRFFSHARRDLDTVGLLLARSAVEAFSRPGEDVTVAVDDTLFHRYGRKVFGALWQHDGSAKGRDGIGRGNCFVVAGLVAAVPFADRKVFLPLLFRLHRPKDGDSKTEQARAMADVLAKTFTGRRIHVVGDALYRGPAWRDLPAGLTFTTRLARNAVLHAPAPPRTGKRGRPALKGARLGTPADLAGAAEWTLLDVRRYGHDDAVLVAVVDCLWHGSLRATPVKVVLVRDPDSPKPYDIALVTTDTAATPEQVVGRYADRWSIEQAFKDCKDLLGAGDAQNRLRPAVERTVPFAMLTLTILTCWYQHAGSAGADVGARRLVAPWYRQKRRIAVTDMLTAYRRARISAGTTGEGAPPENDHHAGVGERAAA